MTKTLRKAMLSTICMLVVAVLSLTGITYAWFTSAKTATVTGMSMNVVAADGGLQISTNATSGWANELTLEDATINDVQPVSTINAANFFKVEFNPANPDQFKTVENDKPTNVWSQVLYIKNTGYNDITVDLTGTRFVDTDAEGDARDISEAARLAVFVYDSLETDANKTLAFILGDEDYKAVKGTSTDYFTIATDTTYLEKPATLKTAAADCTFTVAGGDVDESGEFVENIVKIEVVVWVEGQDAECINKNASSGFNVELSLNATEVQQ